MGKRTREREKDLRRLEGVLLEAHTELMVRRTVAAKRHIVRAVAIVSEMQTKEGV